MNNNSKNNAKNNDNHNEIYNSNNNNNNNNNSDGNNNDNNDNNNCYYFDIDDGDLLFQEVVTIHTIINRFSITRHLNVTSLSLAKSATRRL